MFQKEFWSRQLRPLVHTQRNLFKILLNPTEIRLYYTIFWLIRKQTDVRLLFQINRCIVNTVRFGFDLIRFRKYFSVCTSCLRQRTVFNSVVQKEMVTFPCEKEQFRPKYDAFRLAIAMPAIVLISTWYSDKNRYPCQNSFKNVLILESLAN